MLNFLLRHFVPDYQNTKDPSVRTRCGVLAGALGSVLNMFLFAFKLAVGLLSSSIAIVADAVNNLSDAGSSILSMIGFRLAGQKPDAEHPFGHGRMEYLTGLVINEVILVVGFELARQSIERIRTPEETSFSLVTMVILAVSILVKLYMYSYNNRLSRMLSSVALESTASDARNDCITTGAVLLSSLFTYFSGIQIDGWCGLAVSAFILVSGFQSLLETASPLLGQQQDPELVHNIEAAVLSNREVLGVHDILIHDYGPGRRMMSLHAEVPAGMTLMHAHEIAESMELRMNSEFGIPTVVHIDPIDVNDPETAALRKNLLGFLRDISPDIRFHDFRIVQEKSHKKVIFDLAIPYGFAEDPKLLVTRVQDFIREQDPTYRPIITLDHYDSRS